MILRSFSNPTNSKSGHLGRKLLGSHEPTVFLPNVACSCFYQEFVRLRLLLVISLVGVTFSSRFLSALYYARNTEQKYRNNYEKRKYNKRVYPY